MSSFKLNSDMPVTAVIPAYNEEKNVGNVLGVLRDIDNLTQIIVVDDGSTDHTASVVDCQRRYDPRIQLMSLPGNRGKAGAIAAGAHASTNDLVVFLDADLIGLRPENVLSLVEPVQHDLCAMSVGLFTHGRRPTDLTHKLIPFLSGQRCLRWDLFRGTPDLDAARWGVEVALSFYAWRHHYSVITVPWPGVSHAMRPEKVEGLVAYWSHVQMWLDIGKYVAQHLAGDSERALRSNGRPDCFFADNPALKLKTYLAPKLKAYGSERRLEKEYRNNFYD